MLLRQPAALLRWLTPYSMDEHICVLCIKGMIQRLDRWNRALGDFIMPLGTIYNPGIVHFLKFPFNAIGSLLTMGSETRQSGTSITGEFLSHLTYEY